jgi:hypothetical protein
MMQDGRDSFKQDKGILNQKYIRNATNSARLGNRFYSISTLYSTLTLPTPLTTAEKGRS